MHHVLSTAHGQRSSGDEIELLKVLVKMTHPALKVGVRRDLDKGDCELPRVERFSERSIVAWYVCPLMPVRDLRGIDNAVTPGA